MVKMPSQGDIIKINLDPKLGHEQKGYRPYLCMSHLLVSKTSNIAIFAPISNTNRNYPFYYSLNEENLLTKGKVMLDQLVAVDYNVREYEVIEKVPFDTMSYILDVTKLIFQQNKHFH